ncbi:MAG TPA: ABC transporter ATP-binding protein [Tepidisphaeraceae bacterium]|jgi:spermidine/putrescine transport system ATP-binding protein|nr:ABC transporter ATP-binding protein [Tepidisphaeraceae bacterium]
MDKMVELQHVTKRFGDFVAVAGVDLDIRGGEFLTLLGPSGCGKTTLLRMISGFETPTEGKVLLAGKDVTALPPYRRDVNQVFQSYALFPHLSVWKNVAFGLEMKHVPRGEIRTRVDRAIEMVSLAGFEKRKPSQLSGGQKQRVALARGLVCEPKVLLLDEPLAALDAKLRRLMQIELKRLQSRLGITFLFVTHDQEEALVMSDRIAVVNKGKIEQIGAVSEIYHRPATPFVADFLGQANVLETSVAGKTAAGAELICKGDIRLTIDAAAVDSQAKVLISVRPEKIRLSRRALAGANAFPATIREEIFRGATAQLLLQTPGGLELTAIIANQSAAEDALHQGEQVFCQVHADDVVVLRAV